MAAKPTACLALADGTVFYGHGFGATGEVVAELVFNTAMTGYQEIMTDPSYASQIVTFTFPHIGNTGVTGEDDEATDPVASGIVVRWDPTQPSNWRAAGQLPEWMARRGRIGIGGVILDAQRAGRGGLQVEALFFYAGAEHRLRHRGAADVPAADEDNPFSPAHVFDARITPGG